MYISSNAISTLQPLHYMSVFVDLFCMRVTTCVALLRMDFSLSIVILSLLIFSMMIVNFFSSSSPLLFLALFHSLLIRLVSRYMCTSGSFTLTLEPLHGYNRFQHTRITIEDFKKREKERECVRSCMKKRQMFMCLCFGCVQCAHSITEMHSVYA